MSFLFAKLLHLIAAVLFLGNITTGIFWVHHLARRRDPRLLAEAMAGVIRSDRWLTVPGVVLVISAGIYAAIQGKLSLLGTPWILWSVLAVSASGVLYLPLARLQQRIVARALAAHAKWADCAPLLRRWGQLGGASLLLAWTALALMVLKLPR